MPKNPQFETGEIYHVFNRGVEKRDIYMEEDDYFRFIYSLYECNDRNAVIMRDRMGQRIKRKKQKNVKGVTFDIFGKEERELLVEILAFTLMPNHYHLIVRQVVDNGISLFMKKLGNAYVGYFNDKYKRRGMGSLFQGPFKSAHVKTDEQFIYLAFYVFANPLDLFCENWKKKGIKNAKEAVEYLESYKWSSYADSIGKENFPSVTNREVLMNNFGSANDIKNFVEERVFEESKRDAGLKKIGDFALE